MSRLGRHFALSLALLFLPGELHPATIVSGAIANQTWTKANSPYLVVGDLSIAKLTIQPGVHVQFTSNYVMEVAGTLSAIGSEQEPIVFTQTNRSGGWQGIFFNQSPLPSEMAFCTIEGSTNTGIRVLNCGPVLRDCIIAHNSGTLAGGLYVSNNIPLLLRNCVLSSNSCYGSRGGDGGAINLKVPSATIEGCTIAGNRAVAYGGGIFMWENRTTDLTIIDSTIVGNTVSGDYDGRGGGIAYSGVTAQVLFAG